MEKSPGHQQHPEHKVREQQIAVPLQVEVHGEVVAKSRSVIKVAEDQHPDRYYFPRSDVDMSKLERTETTSRCPFKGLAHYYSVKTPSGPLQDAAWTYEDPYEEHRALKDRIAFYDDKFNEIVVAGVA